MDLNWWLVLDPKLLAQRSASGWELVGGSLVQRIQSAGFDGGCHGHDGCSNGLVQDDVILKCSLCDDGADQRLNVVLSDRTIFCHNVHFTKVCGNVGNMIEDFLKEGVVMPVDLRHVRMRRVIPTSPLGVVDEFDEFNQELTEDGQWAVGSDNGRDDGIHFDTEAQEVENGCHCANASSTNFCLGFLQVKNIHALFCIGYHVPNALLLNHAFVPLRKKG